MSNCSSLFNLLAAIDQAIAEYDITANTGYTDYWKKQIEIYRRKTAEINREIDAINKERIRQNGGYTRGVRG